MKLKAILWMIFAAFSLSLMSVLISLIADQIHFFLLMFYTTFIGLLIAFIFKYFSYPSVIKTTQVKYYVYRGGLSTIAMFMWFYTLEITEVGEAVAITYLTPFLNFASAVILLREKLKFRYTITLICGIVGGLLILRPSTVMGVGPMMALATAIFWSLVDILTKVRAKYDNAATQVFYSYVFMTLFALPFAVVAWHNITTHTLYIVIIIAIIQLFNLYAICQAYHLADLVVVLPFDFTRLIFVAILSFIVFGEILNIWSIIGCIIIAASTIYIYYKEKTLLNNA